MRISDWSSDVCSSDLPDQHVQDAHVEYVPGTHLLFHHRFAGLGVIHRRHARVSCGQSAILTVNGPCSASADANRIAVAAQQHAVPEVTATRSEEHTSELQSLMRISYAVYCLKKKKTTILKHTK